MSTFIARDFLAESPHHSVLLFTTVFIWNLAIVDLS